MNFHLLEVNVNLRVLEGKHSPEQVVHGATLMHPDFPIEQMVRGKDAATRSRLKQELWQLQRAPTEDIQYVAATDGLRVLARTENALQLAVAALCERFGATLSADVPSVRYVYGAQVLEPYMEIRLWGPVPHLDLVRHEVESRRGRILEIDHSVSGFLVRAEAPLARLLGCGAELDVATSGSVALSTRLTRYVRIDHDGPEAA
ncbi:MAG: hypothetical protein IT521_08580 [Burkholderiales bacterium]|nr:hypothetical protein [Burkholderiales bacterium]